MSFLVQTAAANIVSVLSTELSLVLILLPPYRYFMKVSCTYGRAFAQPLTTAAEITTLAAGRDFTTLDGRLIPRALGEEALRQRTAILVGGILIGNWPE